MPGGGASNLLMVVTWAETAFGLFFYGLRFISSASFTHTFRADFWIMTTTILTELAAQIFLQISIHHGMGDHIKDLQPDEVVTAVMWCWVYQYLAIMASVLGKLAIIAFYIQLRRGTNKKPPYLLYGIAGMLLAVNITVISVHLSQCAPYQKLWNPALEGACPRAGVAQGYAFFQASFNTATDAYLTIYPILLIQKMQMPLRVKVGLSILMGMGWIAVICSAVKTYQLHALSKSGDPTYDLHQLLIWASTEAWIVVIVGCVPLSKPVIEKFFQKLGITITGTKSKTGQSGGIDHYKRSAMSGPSSSAHPGRSRATQKDDPTNTWIELDSANDSKEKIVSGNDVLVTTVISTTVAHTSLDEERGYSPGHGHGRRNREAYEPDVFDGNSRAQDIHKVV